MWQPKFLGRLTYISHEDTAGSSHKVWGLVPVTECAVVTKLEYSSRTRQKMCRKRRKWIIMTRNNAYILPANMKTHAPIIPTATNEKTGLALAPPKLGEFWPFMSKKKSWNYLWRVSQGKGDFRWKKIEITLPPLKRINAASLRAKNTIQFKILTLWEHFKVWEREGLFQYR